MLGEPGQLKANLGCTVAGVASYIESVSGGKNKLDHILDCCGHDDTILFAQSSPPYRQVRDVLAVLRMA